MIRRILAGGLLIILGSLLLWSQRGGDAARVVIGLACVLTYAVAGLGVIAGRPWGRVAGLLLAAAGLLGGAFQLSQSGPDGQRVLLEVFFLAGGPSFAWINVGIASAAFAVLSALAGALLLLPISPRGADDETRVARPIGEVGHADDGPR